MELEACEAIYGDDYERLDEGGASPSFEVTLVPEAGAGEDVNLVSLAMRVGYVSTYPEAPPTIALRVVRRGGLTDEDVGKCEELLRDAAASDANLGTPMVYALAEVCLPSFDPCWSPPSAALDSPPQPSNPSCRAFARYSCASSGSLRTTVRRWTCIRR